MAVNHTVFQGRNVRDIEKKVTQTGISGVTFTLAWSEKYKETERKCFLKCKAWRSTADFIDKYLHDKGTEMAVEGTLETEQWQDKDGNNRSETVLNVDRVHFCGKRADAQTAPAQAAPEQAAPAPAAAFDDEEVPF